MGVDPFQQNRTFVNNRISDAVDNANYYKRVNLSGYIIKPTTKTLARIQYTMQSEMQTMDALNKKTEEAEYKKQISERTERLAQELQHGRDTAKTIESRRVHLRNTDPGLLKLASDLRASHVAKIQRAQIMEKEHFDSIGKPDEKAAMTEMAMLWASQDAKAQKELEDRWQARQELRIGLQEQIQNSKYRELHDNELIQQKEKEDINRIIQNNMEAIKREQEEERRKKKHQYQCMQDHLKLKAELAKNIGKVEEIEKRRMEEFNDMVDARKEKYERERKDMENKAEEHRAKLRDYLLDLENQKKDMENNFLILSETMQDMRVAMTGEIERERQAAIKKELCDAFKHHMLVKKHKEEEARLEGIHFRKMMQQVLEDSELYEKNWHMRMKDLQKQYFSDLDNMRQIKLDLAEKSRQREREEFAASLKAQADYLSEVEAERQAMIQEMAPHLLPGCVGRKLLRKSDIPSLQNPLKEFVNSRSRWPPTIQDF